MYHAEQSESEDIIVTSDSSSTSSSEYTPTFPPPTRSNQGAAQTLSPASASFSSPGVARSTSRNQLGRLSPLSRPESARPSRTNASTASGSRSAGARGRSAAPSLTVPIVSRGPTDSDDPIPDWDSVLKERLRTQGSDRPEHRNEEIVFRAFEKLNTMIVNVHDSCPQALLDAVRPPWNSPTFDWDGFQAELRGQGIDHVSDVLTKIKNATTLEKAPIENILFSEGETLVETFDRVRPYWGYQESRGREADAFMNQYNTWHTREGQRNEILDFKLEWTRASIANWISYISAMTLRTSLFLDRNPDRIDEQSMRVRSFLKEHAYSPFPISVGARKCSRNNRIRTRPCESKFVCTVFVQSEWNHKKQETRYKLQACTRCQEAKVSYQCNMAKYTGKSLEAFGNWRVGDKRV